MSSRRLVTIDLRLDYVLVLRAAFAILALGVLETRNLKLNLTGRQGDKKVNQVCCQIAGDDDRPASVLIRWLRFPEPDARLRTSICSLGADGRLHAGGRSPWLLIRWPRLVYGPQ